MQKIACDNPKKMQFKMRGLYLAEKRGLFVRNIHLTLEDADSSNVFINAASNFSVISCNLRQPGINGIYIKRSSPYCVIQNNVINNIPNDAIYTYTNSCQHLLIENNKITRIGQLPGMGAFDGGERAYAGIIFDGTGSICRYNYIDSVGCNGIDCWTNADSMVIQNNYISHCEMVQDDNAAIHSIISAGVNYNTRTITGNILLNGVGAPFGTSNSSDNGFTHGIYLDQRTTKYRITGNTIANMPGSGILLHGTNKDTIRGNTLFNNATGSYNGLPNAQISLRDAGAQGGYNDSAIIVSKNILVSMDTIQKVLALLEVTNTGNACSTYAMYDSNYYCQPFIDTTKIFYVDDITSATNVHFGLQQWKNYSMEVFANPAPVYYQNWSVATTTNVLLIYNAGQSIQTYNLPSGNAYIDVKSNPYSSTVQVNPYSSIVLFYVGSTTGIKEKINNIANQLTIYPNPTNDKIHFGNVPSSISNVNIDVYNALGEKVLNKNINLQTEKILDVTNLLQGAYFVRITNESTTTNYKIVITH